MVLVSLLTLIAGSQNVAAQSQIAQDAYAIFEASCLICHGPDGAYRETLLMEHDALIEGGTVVPGNPNASELYKRLLGTTENGGAQMPLGQPPLPTQSIDTIRRWILAGAPDWAVNPTTDGRFISPDEILASIETHVMSLEPFDRAFARYFTLTHLYNSKETPEILGEYRKALSKLVNSLSWGVSVINPQPIDSQATIFYIDLRHYEWDRIDGWTKIEEAYPYHIAFDAPAQTALREQLGRLQTQMKTDVPSVHVDWFIATASSPPLYHELLSLPSTARELELQLDVDVVGNLTTAPGVRVWRAGFNNSGVSNNNRVVERHTSRYGAYWKSYDFSGSVGAQNIFTHPLNFNHDGGEVIFNLPNGLQGYYLVNASSFRLDEAPINIVSNPAASDPTVRNGLSCIGCHTEGMKTFKDQVRSVIESNTNPPYDKAQALRLYVEKSNMDARVGEDMNRYRGALEATGGAIGGVEPISRFHEAFQGPVDAAYAAAVVGLETQTFLERVRENRGLQNVGLLALEGENGSVKRDTWTSSFRDVMYALDYPEQVGGPPVVTQPDVIPGGQVHIPDPNLRIMIAEELGKNSDVPITVEEMQRLGTLESRDRRVHDLTGLQFATNLTHLELDNSRVSDLSHLKGLTNLNFLEVHGELADLSPIAGLIHLEHLDVSGTKVSDLTPIAGLLINLKVLSIPDSVMLPTAVVQNGFVHIPDPNLRAVLEETLGTKAIIPSAMATLTILKASNRGIFNLAGLEFAVNLEELWISDTSVSDLSPLAGCTNLVSLVAWNTSISDLSPLANLTKLEQLELKGGRLSDISPLVRLTNLRILQFYGGDISDISPLFGMTKLESVRFRHNGVNDISALANSANLEWLDLHANDISDLSPLRNLTKLKFMDLSANRISDVSPLSMLTSLTELELDINKISDVSPLAALRENTKITWHDNPGFPGFSTRAPKIKGPWLWIYLPHVTLEKSLDTDFLSEATGGKVTEVGVATDGATEGSPVGDEVWTLHKLPTTGRNNFHDMLGRTLPLGLIYGNIYLYSPEEQNTTMYLGAHQRVKVWLNGQLIYQRNGLLKGDENYTEFFSATLQQGRNVLLIASDFHIEEASNGFLGFESGTKYTLVPPSIGYVFSPTPIHIGDTFTLDIRAENVFDLAGWQFDIAFDPATLEAVDVSEGDFLKTDGGSTFFQSGRIDNAAGKIMGLIAGRLSEGGVNGSGSVLQVRFKAKSEGETELTLQNFLFGSVTEESILAGPLEVHVTVQERLLTGDVNRDGVINILDLIRVAQQLGKSVPPNSPVDINSDGTVNIFDLTLVAQGIGKTTDAAAPAIATGRADAATIEAWIAQARLVDDGTIVFRQGIANLQNLLASLIIPQETALLANYPNPFNPETWIPYQLAVPAEVALTIYDMSGAAVRRLAIGHQAAGMYQSRNRAAYWDGRNGRGESVASGLYFYTLRAGEFTATRKMLIRK